MREETRRHLRRGLLWTAAVLMAPLLGCDAQQNYLIWPTSARTGDTVAILFNTEWDTQWAPDAALLDASIHNIVVQVSDSTEWTESITPRFVIEAPAALGSQAVGQGLASVTGLVAIFDLPDPWPNGSLSFPDEFTVVVEYKGSATFGANELWVLGSGGAPIEFSYSTRAELLELRPMLRLRPAWDAASGEGFDPGWEIGALEFTLRYTPGAGEVSSVGALGNGEAAAGLAMATELLPEGSDKLWRIVLLHPAGFELPERGCTGGGDCFSGRWSLLDLPLEVDTTGLADGETAFVPDDFAIEDLRVVDRDGVPLNPEYAGERFFHSYAANNIVPIPEPGMVLLLTSGVLGLAVLKRLARRRRTRCGR